MYTPLFFSPNDTVTFLSNLAADLNSANVVPLPNGETNMVMENTAIIPSISHSTMDFPRPATDDDHNDDEVSCAMNVPWQRGMPHPVPEDSKYNI